MAETDHATPRKVGDVSEDGIIENFFAPIAADLCDDVAAITPAADCELLVSTDALQEGIHFLREAPANLVAQKALRANVSDILSSGGRPKWFSLALSLPRDLELRWLTQFSSGLMAAMNETGVSLIGGDTTAAVNHIAISITILGVVPKDKRISRKGARPGDLVCVTGTMGDASIGLELLLGNMQMDRLDTYAWLERHFCPPYRGRFAQALAAHQYPTAMMDLSDGLLSDLPRLCKASSVGVRLDLADIPINPDASQLGVTPEKALRAGEDFELLFCLPPEHWQQVQQIALKAETPVHCIGKVSEEAGLQLVHKGEPVDASTLHAWKHFA